MLHLVFSQHQPSSSVAVCKNNKKKPLKLINEEITKIQNNQAIFNANLLCSGIITWSHWKWFSVHAPNWNKIENHASKMQNKKWNCCVVQKVGFEFVVCCVFISWLQSSSIVHESLRKWILSPCFFQCNDNDINSPKQQQSRLTYLW